jgi:hypothetical protein
MSSDIALSDEQIRYQLAAFIICFIITEIKIESIKNKNCI